MAVVGHHSQTDRDIAQKENLLEAPEGSVKASRLKRPLPGAHARLIAIGQIVLWAILILLLAKIFWSLFAPLSVPSEAPIIPATQQNKTSTTLESEISARNPFALAQVTFVEEVAPVDDEIVETNLALTLHGVRIGGANATAIIDVNTGDNSRRGQGVFTVGDEITDGVELIEIHAGEVIISRDGVREALRLKGAEGQADESRRAGQQPSARRNNNARNRANLNISEDGNVSARSSNRSRQNRSSVSTASLQDVVQVRRRTLANGQFGLFLYPGTNRQAFTEAGLVARDMLLSVNGTPPPTDIRQLFQLMQRFSGTGSVSLVVERDGTPKTINVKVPTVEENQRSQRNNQSNGTGDEVKL